MADESQTDQKEVKWYKTDDESYEATKPAEQSNQNDEQMCHICEQSFDKLPASKLDCGDQFHADCLREWAKEMERGCPTCSSLITLDDGKTLAEFLQEREKRLAKNERELWGVVASIAGYIIDNSV